MQGPHQVAKKSTTTYRIKVNELASHYCTGTIENNQNEEDFLTNLVDSLKTELNSAAEVMCLTTIVGSVIR